MSPIRIAQIIGNISYGVGSVVLNYYRKIDKDQFQFDFYTYAPSPLDQEIIALGGRVFFMKSFRRPFSASRSLYKMLAEQNYSAVHSHLNTLNRFALAAAEKAGIPVRIAHNHSTSFPLEWSTPLKYLLKRTAAKHSTHQAACSLSSARWIFGSRPNVFILPNAIDVEKFKYNPAARQLMRRQFNVEDKFVIGHAGRFSRQKNHTFIIKTMRKLAQKESSAQLVLAGGGKLMGKIRKQIKRYNLDDSVIILERRNDMENIYQLFDVFILPSFYEGLPLVAVEAQAAGLPVLLSSNITKESDICNTTYLSLKSSWTEEILSKKSFERSDTSDCIRASGFDIQTEVLKLEEFYKNIIK